MSGGSATGNPRNKVALTPGHSLVDWIRLGNSGVDLTGTKGRILDITKEELAKHNVKDDAWMCIRGKVYNVTKYLEFHPGGVEELLKGIGTDATKLFTNVHPWVNYESLLQKCFVGNLLNATNDDVFISPTFAPKKTIFEPSMPDFVIKFEWYQKISSFVLSFQIKTPIKQLHLNSKIDGELWMYLDECWFGWKLGHRIDWPPLVEITENEDYYLLEISLKKGHTPWGKLHRLSSNEKPAPSTKSQLKIIKITNVNHNVQFIHFSFENKVYNYIPIGYHLTLNAKINEIDLERQYTPVSGLNENDNRTVKLMVKSYPDGIFSSWLCNLKINDMVCANTPIGHFSTDYLSNVTDLFLVAAGTGFTPMTRLIYWGLNKKKINVSLMFFNREEKDIIWKEELDELTKKNKRFHVVHILSKPDSTWKGKSGYITLQLLQSVLPDFSNSVLLPYFVCVCGPIAFTQMTERFFELCKSIIFF